MFFLLQICVNAMNLSRAFFFFFICIKCFLLQVRRKIDLIYGGGSVGLMGLVSKTVHDGGCHVLG